MLDRKQLSDLSEYYVSQMLQPKVILIPTDSIKTRLQSLGLSVSGFLAPFFNQAMGAAFKGQAPPESIIKSLGREKRVPNFRLTPVELSDYSQPSYEDVNTQIGEVLRRVQPDVESISQSAFRTRQEVEQHLREHKTEWYDQAVKSLYQMTRYNLDASSLDAPLAIVYLLDYQDGLDTLQNLQSQSSRELTHIFRQSSQGHLNIPCTNLILFDNQQDFALASSLNKQVKAQFSSSSNSIFAIDSPESTPQTLWPGQRSISMSKADVTCLYEICRKLTNETVVSIETKIQVLDQNLQVNKKGFKNYMKNIFKAKEKIQDPHSYSLNPQELQHLELAELLLLVTDYAEAHNYLKWLLYELKDKSHRHYVHVLESTAICQLLLLHTKAWPSITEGQMMAMGELLDSAFALARTHEYLHRQVYKLLANVLAYQRIFGRFTRITAQNTFNMIQESKEAVPALSAFIQCLFKEQHALMYLKMSPVNFRKYCMYQLFTGHKYRYCRFYAHSIRCYQVALVYNRHFNWKPINDYLFTHLAMSHQHLKRFPEALAYYKQAFNLCDKFESQQKHHKLAQEIQSLLSELDQDDHSSLVTLVQSSERQALKLPLISKSSIDITLQKDNIKLDNQEWYYDYIRPKSTPLLRPAPSEARPGRTQQVWTPLYKQIHQQMINTNVKDSRGFLVTKQEGELVSMYDSLNLYQKNQTFKKSPRVSYVGNTVRLLFFMTNPLKIPLEVSRILPIFTGEVQCEPLDLVIKQLDVDVSVTLTMKLLQPGMVSILGIRWKVFGLDCQLMLDLPESNKKNLITVLEKQAFLAIQIPSFDNRVFCHEVREIKLQLTNPQSDNTVKHVFIQSSSDRLVFPKVDQEISPGDTLHISAFIRGGRSSRQENIAILVKSIDMHNQHYLQRLILPVSSQESVAIRGLKAFQGTQSYMFNFQVESLVGSPGSLLDDTVQSVQINKITLLNPEYQFSGAQSVRQLCKYDNLNFQVQLIAPQEPTSLADQVQSAAYSLVNPATGPSPLEAHLPVIARLMHPVQEEEHCLSHLRFLLFWQYQLDDELVTGVLDDLSLDICGAHQLDVLKTFPLKIDLVSEETHFTHNFQETPVFKVEMQIVIKNTSSLHPLSFQFQIANQDDQQYFLQGKSKLNVTDLAHNATVTQPITCLFLQPGFYNVSKYQVTFSRKQDSQACLSPLSLGNPKDVITRTFTSEELQDVKYICIQ